MALLEQIFKTMKNLVCSTLFSILLLACSSDDSTDSTEQIMQEDNVSLVGTWDVIEFQLEPLDLNGDGTASESLFDELPCFTSEITFTEEGSYAAKTADFVFEGTSDDFTIDCDGTSTEVGVYVWENEIMTRDEGTDDELSVSAIISGNELTISGQDENFGEVLIVYEKR